MHKYKCSDCTKISTGVTLFLTDFAPVFDAPAFCPNCGKDETVSYVGEVNHDSNFEIINELMRKLYDIKKGSVKYGLSDLSDWLEHDLEKVCVMLDQLQYEVKGGE